MNRKILSLITLIIFACSINNASALYQPKLVSVDESSQLAIIEIDGQEYEVRLDQPRLKAGVSTTTEEEDYAELERQFMAMQAEEDKYTGLPSVLNLRLFTLPTDRMVEAGHFALDFTHRFATPVDEDTASDLYGLDGFAYNSFGVHYGVTDWFNIYAQRGNVGDMVELGAKVKVLSEGKGFDPLHPFNVTLNMGAQNDNLQNSIDPYFQTIISRSIIPNRVQVYFSPTIAWGTSTIARDDSDSAIFFTFLDEQGRGTEDTGTVAIPYGIAIEIVKNKATLVGEIVPVIGGFYENNMGWSAGLQFLSSKETHIWTVGVSNMPYVTTGQMLVGGPDNDVHLGFNVNIFL